MFKSLSQIFSHSEFSQDGPNRQQKAKSGNKKVNYRSPDYTVFDFLQLLEAWPDIVGERAAQFTHPLKNTGGVLTILTGHPVFAQQLSFMEEKIKENIYARFP
ncbi:MAG: DUF721 domain-containing protein, partial [Pseudomonadota bacterium]